MDASTVANTAAAINIVLSLLDRATQIGNIIKQAQDAGRDVTADELNHLMAADGAARQDLVDAIAAAKVTGN